MRGEDPKEDDHQFLGIKIPGLIEEPDSGDQVGAEQDVENLIDAVLPDARAVGEQEAGDHAEHEARGEAGADGKA